MCLLVKIAKWNEGGGESWCIDLCGFGTGDSIIAHAHSPLMSVWSWFGKYGLFLLSHDSANISNRPISNCNRSLARARKVCFAFLETFVYRKVFPIDRAISETGTTEYGRVCPSLQTASKWPRRSILTLEWAQEASFTYVTQFQGIFISQNMTFSYGDDNQGPLTCDAGKNIWKVHLLCQDKLS